MLLRIIICLFFSFLNTNTFSQSKKVAVIGSSSAYGYFPGTSIPRDSGWVAKVAQYYKSQGILDTLYNLGTPGIDCYITMPTGYVPPPGRYAPDPHFNITKAASYQPDVIIINLPSNNYTALSMEEILFCLQTMFDYATGLGITTFITTTQPRDDYYNLVDRLKLKAIKDSTIQRFGVYALDFWTPIVDEATLFIRTIFTLGDLVHLNPSGHTQLANVVIQKNIFFAPVAINNLHWSVVEEDGVLIEWKWLYPSECVTLTVERSRDGQYFEPIEQLIALPHTSGVVRDSHPFRGVNYYRIKTTLQGEERYSEIKYISISANVKWRIYPNPYYGSNLNFRFDKVRTKAHIIIYNNQGEILYNYKWENIQGSPTLHIPFYPTTKGIYWIKVADEPGNMQQLVVP
jgi:lysophospholipase L1-like esterase